MPSSFGSIVNDWHISIWFRSTMRASPRSCELCSFWRSYNIKITCSSALESGISPGEGELPKLTYYPSLGTGSRRGCWSAWQSWTYLRLSGFHSGQQYSIPTASRQLLRFYDGSGICRLIIKDTPRVGLELCLHDRLRRTETDNWRSILRSTHIHSFHR